MVADDDCWDQLKNVCRLFYRLMPVQMCHCESDETTMLISTFPSRRSFQTFICSHLDSLTSIWRGKHFFPGLHNEPLLCWLQLKELLWTTTVFLKAAILSLLFSLILRMSPSASRNSVSRSSTSISLRLTWAADLFLKQLYVGLEDFSISDGSAAEFCPFTMWLFKMLPSPKFCVDIQCFSPPLEVQMNSHSKHCPDYASN